jgi:RNA polymerase sigma-70 factor (ECF subfamily)
MELTDHLFRHEAGRMVAVLTRIFGVHNLALAEDVVQDAFCRALEVWSFRGVPENPSAWLMAAAKNRALDVLRREHTARTYEPELTRWLQSEWTLAPVVEEMFIDTSIKDDQLRMMFSCCHPRLAEEAQVMLILNILCGFGIDEIAAAFVTTYTAVEKRIPRAKKVLAGRRGYSTRKLQPISRLDCQRSSEHYICCSTRAITAPQRSRRCVLNFVRRPCDWLRSFWNIRAARRRVHMLFAH